MAREQYGKVDPAITRDSTLPDCALRIYSVLTTYCDKDRKCYPSIDTLLRDTGYTNTTFYKYMKVLEQRGIVKKTYEKTGSGNFDRKLIYELCDMGK